MHKITINIIDYNGKKHIINTPIDSKSSLMDILKEAGFEIGNCGGMALCASCHCYIENNNNLNPKTIQEEDMLDQLHNSDFNSRLICQIPLTIELDGLLLKMVND